MTAAYFAYALAYNISLADFIGAAAARIGTSTPSPAADSDGTTNAARKWWSALSAMQVVTVSLWSSCRSAHAS